MFLRRARRLVTFATILLTETAYLAATVRRRPASESGRYRSERQSIACARAVQSIGITVVINGSDRPDAGCLIVSNHLGMIDPFIIGGEFRVVFSAKAEMLEWPIAGWVCRTIDLIPVYRGSRSRTGDFAAAVADRLRAGLNVLAFPEGTTSGGTDILPFKTGAFAAVEGLEDGIVLPVTLRVVKIDGRAPDSDSHALFTWADTSKSLISHFWQLLGIGAAVVEIDIGQPVLTAGRSRKELADTAYEIIRASSSAQPLRHPERRE